MSGFRNMREWSEAAEGGQNWITQFRKAVPLVTTTSGHWFDFSMGTGNPPANYYASTPLIAATLDGGIYAGPSVSPAQKFIQRATVMNVAATTTQTTSQNLGLRLLDYLLYYPFVDMDAAGEEQLMDNTVTLPRYSDGAGVRIMAVAQGTTAGSGQYTVKYTNQDGVTGQVTPNHFCPAAQPSGTLVSATQAAGGFQPFLSLAPGDTGVRAIESVTFSVANGGLVGFVLVKPLMTIYSREESRRTTTGTIESFGSAVEKEMIRQQVCGPQIFDNAFLGFIGQGSAGTLQQMQLVGTLETIWN